jgi:hypothetical protein
MVHLFYKDSSGRLGGGSLLGVQKYMRSRAQGMGISLLGGLNGEFGRVLKPSHMKNISLKSLNGRMILDCLKDADRYVSRTM